MIKNRTNIILKHNHKIFVFQRATRHPVRGTPEKHADRAIISRWIGKINFLRKQSKRMNTARLLFYEFSFTISVKMREIDDDGRSRQKPGDAIHAAGTCGGKGCFSRYGNVTRRTSDRL